MAQKIDDMQNFSDSVASDNSVVPKKSTLENDNLDVDVDENENSNQDTETKNTTRDELQKQPARIDSTTGPIDPLEISKTLGYQIFRKTRRNAWSADEDQSLRKFLIAQYLRNNNLTEYNGEPIDIKDIDWVRIAGQINTKRKAKECKKRWVSSLDPYLKKGKWTQREDDALIQAFKKYGPAWQKVAAEIEGRNEDQCSKRYTEVLNSDTKDRLKPWTIEEDLILIEKAKLFGTKWRQISTYLPTRPSLTCRNRWRKIITDLAKGIASDVIKKAIGLLDENGKPIIEFKQNNAQIAEKGVQSQQNGQKRGPTEDIEVHENENNREAKKQDKKESPKKPYNSTTAYPRIENPVKTQTDWNYTFVDPRTNEEIKSFNGKISNQELAHYLIELAKFNGVSLTVHQHIHHHYSSLTSIVSSDPQTNISRSGHFNYLPPLVEVPKLTSSSSPDNTADSPNSSKNFSENPLLRLLNNDDNQSANGSKSRPISRSRNNSSSNSNNNNKSTNKSANKDNSSTSNNISSKSHRQQFGSTTNSPGLDFTDERGNTLSTSKHSDGKHQTIDDNKYISTDLGDELDFWETMKSINQPKNNKPVSQHHPLHYHQPSAYKEQIPYQPSDTFGIQRFPNMATPLVGNLKNSQSVQTNITSVSNDEGFNDMYIGNANADEDDEEEEEMDIANQYGMYYSVFTNKSQSQGSFGKTPNNGVNNGPSDLVNSGYLMPFNPS